MHWGIEHPGEYRTIVGGAMPEQLGPLNAHGAGQELLNALVRALAAASGQVGPGGHGGEPPTADKPWRAGLVLWTGLHGLVSLYNSHGDLPWPALDGLLAQLLSLHTGCTTAEIEGLMAA